VFLLEFDLEFDLGVAVLENTPSKGM